MQKFAHPYLELMKCKSTMKSERGFYYERGQKNKNSFNQKQVFFVNTALNSLMAVFYEVCIRKSVIKHMLDRVTIST